MTAARKVCAAAHGVYFILFWSDLACLFCSLVRSFYFFNVPIHLIPFPLFNVLKVNNDELPLQVVLVLRQGYVPEKRHANRIQISDLKRIF
jgi:hypothetical protein